MSNWIEEIIATQEYVKSIHDQLLKRSEIQVGELDQDRFLSSYNRLLRRSPQERIFSGRVTDLLPYQNWYRVFLDDMIAPLACTLSVPTGTSVFGTRWLGTLPLGSRVLVYVPHNANYGIILGVEPFLRSPHGTSFSDFVSLQSAHSPVSEPSRLALVELSKGREILDWSSDRPYDACGAGETGIFSETGGGLFVDSAMTYLRASESCGVWAFYADELLRLSGQNFQLRTSLGQEEHFNDQGELWGHCGFCAYPWELFGAFQPGQIVYRQQDPEDAIYRIWEPLYDDQTSFYRYEEYYGYAANLGCRRQVNVRLRPASVYKHSSAETNVSVFHEQVQGDGTYHISSGRSISFIRRFPQPMPHRLYRPEDPQGDSNQNYKPSGYFNNASQHRLRQDANSPPDSPILRSQQSLDYLAYLLNWQSLVAFHYHKKDYYVPEEREVAALLGANFDRPLFSTLRRQFSLPYPPASTIFIDHRFGQVPYYQNTAFFSLTEDGGIVLSDGYGAEIVLSGGHIYLRCPGDLHLQAGRRIIQLAGGDVLVRARENCELSTSLADIRISSGRHSYYHSSGGILLQSDSLDNDLSRFPERVGSDCQIAGIILRALQSGIQTYSSLFYAYSSQRTYFDCARSQADFFVSAQNAYYQLGSALTVAIGTEDDRQVSLLSRTRSHIASPLSVRGDLSVLGSVLVEDWVYSTDGHIASGLAERYDGKTVPLSSEEGDSQALISLRERLTDIHGFQQDTQEMFAQLQNNLNLTLFSEGQVGSDRVIANAAFSFRTTAQYGAEDYYLTESRWQMLGRLQAEPLPSWTERVVRNTFSETSPFPGLERMRTSGSLRLWTPRLLDPSTGVPIDRTEEVYVDSDLSSWENATLLSDYKVVGIPHHGTETGS
jgi:hypothetical protein